MKDYPVPGLGIGENGKGRKVKVKNQGRLRKEKESPPLFLPCHPNTTSYLGVSAKPKRDWKRFVADPISTHDTKIVINQSQHAVITSVTRA